MKITNEKQKNQLKIGVILNYINLAVGTLIPIFYTPVMLRILGQNEYGLFKLASSVTSYLNLITMGLGSAVSRYLIKAQTEEGKEAEEKILGLFMIVFQIIAGITFIVGTVLTIFLGTWYGDSLSEQELIRMKIIVFILVCNTTLSFQISPYLSIVSTHERFLFQQIMNIISTCVGPILNLVILLFGFASIGMSVSTLVLSIISRSIYIVYIRKVLDIKAQYKGIPTHLIREILVFSFWIFVANIVTQLYNSTDTVMIGTVPNLGTRGVAVYNVGSTFMSMTFSMTVGISSILSPKANKMVFSGASNTELTDLTIRIGRLQGYIAMLITTGFVAFGRPFIEFYAGTDYADAYWVAVLIMIPNIIPLVQSVCFSIVVARNQHKFRSLVYLGIAILNVIGSWLLLKTRLGIIGAALMTGIATVLGQGFAMNWYYWKKTGLEIGRFWKVLSKQYIIPVFMCMITLLISKWIDFYSIPILIAGIVVYTLIYGILNWLFIMNEYEKNLILVPLNKMQKKLEKRKLK